MEWMVPIAVAVITGPVVVILQRLRKENTSQHAESRSLLEHVVERVDDLHVEFKSHLKNHK